MLKNTYLKGKNQAKVDKANAHNKTENFKEPSE